jgi:DNA-binding beta-propeller fold protein YncE
MGFEKSRGRDSGIFFFAAFLSLVLSWPILSNAALIAEYEQVLEIATSQEKGIRPTAVTLDEVTGDICVTDAQYAKLYVLNKHGVEMFRTGGFSNLSYPVDGSLTSDGDFIFVGKGRNGEMTIRRLNFMGEPVNFIPEIPIEGWRPQHLTITRDGHILTLDSFLDILTKHNSRTGAILWLTEISDEGSDDLRLGRPAESPDGRIYLPVGKTKNVMIFSADGKILETMGEFGTGPGKFVFPVGVAMGPGGLVLILDAMRHKVLMFDSDHNFLSEFGGMGAGLGQLYHPSAIAASEDGKVYVAQGYESRVQVFNIRDTKAE